MSILSSVPLHACRLLSKYDRSISYCHPILPFVSRRIEVVNTATGEAAVFPLNDWINKKAGLERILTPDADGDGKGDEAAAGVLVDYTVKVITSDIK